MVPPRHPFHALVALVFLTAGCHVFLPYSPPPGTDLSLQLVVRTLAGTLGTSGYQDGLGLTAQFDTPYGLAAGSQGKLYVADRNNNCIRALDTTTWMVSTFAGACSTKAEHVDGPALAARFDTPRGVAVDSADVVYVADKGNHRIRIIANGQVTTLAGNGTAGFLDGPAYAAQFQNPYGVAVDGSGKVYVSDMLNKRIRTIDVTTSMVSTLAGSGAAGCADGPAATAQFELTYLIAASALGEVYVADPNCKSIRLVAPDGTVSTFAGSVSGFQDGPIASALFDSPHGVAVDSQGRVYVADTDNFRIRIIDGGQVSTLAGSGTQGVQDGPALQAQLDAPYGIAVDSAGRVYFSEKYAHVVRVIEPQ